MTSLGWALTLAAIAALLALDLVVSARRSGPVGLRAAGAWSVFYVGVALAFGVVLGVLAGWDLGAQYFAGYVVEKSLSVDNLFVFVIIVAAFAVPAEHQSRALTIGIVDGAGPAGDLHRPRRRAARRVLVHVPHLRPGPAGHRRAAVSPPRPGAGGARQPAGHGRAPGTARVRRLRGRAAVDWGRRAPGADPMFLVLVAIGTTDVLFALDSIPAVFGVTRPRLHRVLRQRVRAARAARPVLPRLRAARPPDLPLDRPVADPGLHRRQARPSSSCTTRSPGCPSSPPASRSR